MKVINPTIILVKPQLPENIGMVARAMQNCGLKKLFLVSPRENWPNQKSIDSSTKARNIIKNTKVFLTLKEALSTFHYVIATSARKRFIHKPHFNNFDLLFKDIPNNKKIAIIFGPENSGLSNEDLILCDSLFSIPLSIDNNSLNLSHSVLLMMYKFNEFFVGKKKLEFPKSNLSSKKEFQNFMDYLNKELEKSGFYYPKEKKTSMINNIQSMFLRAKLSNIEIKTLRGMFKKLVNSIKN